MYYSSKLSLPRTNQSFWSFAVECHQHHRFQNIICRPHWRVYQYIGAWTLALSNIKITDRTRSIKAPRFSYCTTLGLARQQDMTTHVNDRFYLLCHPETCSATGGHNNQNHLKIIIRDACFFGPSWVLIPYYYQYYSYSTSPPRNSFCSSP